jgi:acetylornithine deacetylase/succinyl-diaminopimelate desuccinylase-like protein
LGTTTGIIPACPDAAGDAAHRNARNLCNNTRRPAQAARAATPNLYPENPLNKQNMRTTTIAAAAMTLAIAIQPACAQALSPDQQLAKDIFRELIEIESVTTRGDTLVAAEAMAARLRAAGFSGDDVQVFSPAPHKGNLVARLHGAGAKKPMLLLAHTDVVDAKREDWSIDPFKFTEKDGYYYGRGTTDDKPMAAQHIATLIRLKKEGYKPNRDIIVALETDEEAGGAGNGIQWLLKNKRDLIDAEFAINEGGGLGMQHGKPYAMGVQTSEKIYQSFRLEVKNAGGHSSLPTKDNAIYHLSEGLARLGRYDFPMQLNETTRLYFERMSRLETGQTAADMKAVTLPNPDPAAIGRLSAIPFQNSQLRTTCVATRLEGGHADNALPQLARALVNCRILPGTSVPDVQKTIVRVIGDDKISVTPENEPILSDPSPLNPEIMNAIEKLTSEFWPGTPVVPTMLAGATDGLFLRNAGIPTYGNDGNGEDLLDVRAHGKDERILVKSYFEGLEYEYRLVKMLSGGK